MWERHTDRTRLISRIRDSERVSEKDTGRHTDRQITTPTVCEADKKTDTLVGIIPTIVICICRGLNETTSRGHSSIPLTLTAAFI